MLVNVVDRPGGVAAAEFRVPRGKRWVNLHNDLLALIQDYGVDTQKGSPVPLGSELRPLLPGFGRSSVKQSTPEFEMAANVGIVFRNRFLHVAQLTNPETGLHEPDHYAPRTVDEYIARSRIFDEHERRATEDYQDTFRTILTRNDLVEVVDDPTLMGVVRSFEGPARYIAGEEGKLARHMVKSGARSIGVGWNDINDSITPHGAEAKGQDVGMLKPGRELMIAGAAEGNNLWDFSHASTQSILDGVEFATDPRVNGTVIITHTGRRTPENPKTRNAHDRAIQVVMQQDGYPLVGTVGASGMLGGPEPEDFGRNASGIASLDKDGKRKTGVGYDDDGQTWGTQMNKMGDIVSFSNVVEPVLAAEGFTDAEIDDFLYWNAVRTLYSALV